MITTLQNGVGASAESRNYQNIRKKYLQYLIPCTLTAVATSLSSFVDSIIVSNLLDASALSIVNLASPVMFVFSTVYTILGVGGSAMYSVNRGNHDRKKADEIFSLAMIIAILTSVFLSVVGVVSSPFLAQLLGRGSGLEVELSSFLKVQAYSALPIIVSCLFAMFLPACGHPVLATVVNMVSNAVNLVFDVIFIKWFKMGVNGAALATLTGFSVGLIVLLVVYFRRKDDIAQIHFSTGILRHFKEIITTGLPVASTQIGYAIKVSFCNFYAAKFAGESGVLTFAIYMQVMSLISIFLAGVFDTLLPFYSTLKGLNDRKGQTYVIRLSAVILTVVSCVFFLILQVWPQGLAYIFAIDPTAASEVVAPAVRIFSWVLLCRWVYLEIRNILSVLGMKWYSLMISLADGFVLPVLLSVILCPIMGINGLWWALLLTSAVITVTVFIINKVIVKRSGGRYKGFWLIDESSKMLGNLTIDSDLNNISTVTREIEQVCRKNELMMSRAMLVAISVEEMSIIIRDSIGERNLTPIDILIQKRDDEIMVDFCSVGTPLNSVAREHEEDFDNFEMLKRISKSVTYDYVLGMNITRIVLSL